MARPTPGLRLPPEPRAGVLSPFTPAGVQWVGMTRQVVGMPYGVFRDRPRGLAGSTCQSGRHGGSALRYLRALLHETGIPRSPNECLLGCHCFRGRFQNGEGHCWRLCLARRILNRTPQYTTHAHWRWLVHALKARSHEAWSEVRRASSPTRNQDFSRRPWVFRAMVRRPMVCVAHR